MRAFLVAGLGFGDEAKGATVDALTREFPADTIVRYNGGCQAAHSVVTPEGVHHTFSQFGSGMLASPTVKTHLSRFMLVEPISMMHEAEALSQKTPDVWKRTTVDARAVMTTPMHSHLNRLREKVRGNACHGSCGRGIGVTRELQIKYGDQVLQAGDVRNPELLLDKLYFLRSVMESEIRELESQLQIPHERFDFEDLFHSLAVDYLLWPAKIVTDMPASSCIVFEGAQGVMLDEKHGTAPHNTWTDTTFNNADTLLDEIGIRERVRIGCLRTYYTRHGAGPFHTEDIDLDLPEPHNGTGEFQGAFRFGHFDFGLAKKALDIVGGVDCLAISHIDYLSYFGIEEKDFLSYLERRLKTPVGIEGRGPTASQRTFRYEVLESRDVRPCTDSECSTAEAIH